MVAMVVWLGAVPGEARPSTTTTGSTAARTRCRTRRTAARVSTLTPVRDTISGGRCLTSTKSAAVPGVELPIPSTASHRTGITTLTLGYHHQQRDSWFPALVWPPPEAGSASPSLPPPSLSSRGVGPWPARCRAVCGHHPPPVPRGRRATSAGRPEYRGRLGRDFRHQRRPGAACREVEGEPVAAEAAAAGEATAGWTTATDPGAAAVEE